MAITINVNPKIINNIPIIIFLNNAFLDCTGLG